MTMARSSRSEEGRPLERVLELIDEKVEQRAQHERSEIVLTASIAELAEEARRHGATMPQLTQHVRRLDRSSGEVRPITRQALAVMLARKDGRARTTRESRRRRDAEPAGRVNMDALS
jgi:hypothetical protein